MSTPKWHSKVIHSVIALLLVALALVLNSGPVSVLAAPVVNSVTETAFDTDATEHYVNMPTTVDAGDLLIVLFTNDGDTLVNTPAGWSLMASDVNSPHVRLSVYYKIAAGTEDDTTVNFVTETAEEAAAQVYRITNWHGTTPPEISTAVTGSGKTPDPASLDPAGWDVADTLWLAVAGQDKGDEQPPTYPASYTDGISTLSSTGNEGCQTHSARRVLTAASEDPGAFTIPANNKWVAFTIAVRPAPRDLTISSTEGGSVTTPGEGTFPYDDGTVVDLVAEADACYEFVNWTGDVGTIADVNSPTTTITMNDNYSITANFDKISYNLTTGSTTGGSVTTPGEDTFPYDCGTVVDLVAQADACYEFVNWSGDVGTVSDVNAASTNITMSGDYSITANFEEIPPVQYDFIIAADPEVGGTATDLTNESPYIEGTEVNIKAEAADGYEFVNWTAPAGGFDNANDAETTFTMPAQNVTVTANFEEITPPPEDPTVTTKAATNVSTDSATPNMSYTVGNFSQVEVRFAYKKSTGSAWSYTDWVFKSGNSTHAEPLPGLDSSTAYEFKAQLKYNDTLIEGTTLQFTTDTPSDSPPSEGCFIATAAYGTPTAEQIEVLREFRDIVLLESTAGSQFVTLYYRFSPPVADFISENSFLRTLVRELLIDPIVWVVETTGDIWRN
jgi:uncharacterized repeat protein (TIGR02543 family)